jgi:hypothetical protein
MGSEDLVKGLLSQRIHPRESWTIALDLTKLGQKAAHQKNTSQLIRNSYSLFLEVIVKKRVTDDDDNDDQ